MKIQSKIDSILDKGKNSALSKAREEVSKLRSKKGALIDEKKAIRAKLDVVKNEGDKITKDRKDARSNVKFSSLEEIMKEIKKLQRKQETTTMSLTEEKKLIKEIDALKASKMYVVDIKNKDAAMDGVKDTRKSIGSTLATKDKEIDAVSAEIDEKMVGMKAMNEKDTEKRDKLQSWFKERDDFRAQFTEKLKEKDSVRATFREQNNAWYNAARAVRARNQIQYEEDKKLHAEETAEYDKKVEEEEAKKIPYEAEQALCEYLADYLTKTYLTDAPADAVEETKNEETTAIKDDPFANFKPTKKNEDEIFFGKGKGKKKRERSNKNQNKKSSGPFTLSVDTFEQFGLIGLNPPTAVAHVEGAVKDLHEKKEWFSKQPRGSVPTANDIRKKNDKAAQKLQQNGNKSEKKASAPKGGGKFALTSDDFAPLPGANSGSNAPISLWGKPAGMAAPSANVVSADPTPEEAAQSS